MSGTSGAEVGRFMPIAATEGAVSEPLTVQRCDCGCNRISHNSDYQRWKAMLRRCRDPRDPAYEAYGGRGIGVCERWLTFANYLADVGPKPEGMSLDRIDNDGDYSPENTQWADAQAQSWNQRNPPGLRTHCPKNHPYDEQNTYVTPKGKRDCRACRREASRRRELRRKGEAA